MCVCVCSGHRDHQVLGGAAAACVEVETRAWRRGRHKDDDEKFVGTIEEKTLQYRDDRLDRVMFMDGIGPFIFIIFEVVAWLLVDCRRDSFVRFISIVTRVKFNEK